MTVVHVYKIIIINAIQVMKIESDRDLHGALVCLLEVAEAGSDAVSYRTLHIEECVEVMMQRDKHVEPLEVHPSSKRPSTDADGQAAKRKKHI